VDLAMTGEVLLAYALAVALGAWLRRTVPAIGGALASSLVLLIATGLTVRTLTPASHTAGPHFTVPLDGWIIESPNGHSVPYHPASQYWPLQLTFLAIALALAAALLASGWYATRTRAISLRPGPGRRCGRGSLRRLEYRARQSPRRGRPGIVNWLTRDGQQVRSRLRTAVLASRGFTTPSWPGTCADAPEAGHPRSGLRGSHAGTSGPPDRSTGSPSGPCYRRLCRAEGLPIGPRELS
jgi:hypothetical protein